MRFYHFRYGYKSGREFGMMVGPLQFRLARHQTAMWVNDRPVFNFLY